MYTLFIAIGRYIITFLRNELEVRGVPWNGIFDRAPQLKYDVSWGSQPIGLFSSEWIMISVIKEFIYLLTCISVG